jgi:hypothetical protein
MTVAERRVPPIDVIGSGRVAVLAAASFWAFDVGGFKHVFGLGAMANEFIVQAGVCRSRGEGS